MPPDTTVDAGKSTGTLAARTLWRLVLLAPLFVAAGRPDWPRGWILASLILGSIAFNFALMRWKNPSLIRARLERHDNVESFDRKFFAVAVPLALVFFVVAGLDERLEWSTLPRNSLWVGILLHLAGTVPIALTSVHNPFLELAVRLQTDRAQVAVQTGPYRFVRHPMYFGLLLMFAAWPLVVDSSWSYVPLAALAAAYVVRTALEDRALRQRLPGYEEYTRLTRYRLLPGIW